MNKKTIYTIGGIAVAIGLAAFIVFYKKDDDDDDEGGNSGGGSTSKIPEEQKKPDLSLDAKIRAGTTKGLIIKSKVNGVILRTRPYVNDGFINNQYGEVPNLDTIIGDVTTNPLNDQGGAWNQRTQQYYKWLGVKITKAVYDEIQKNQRNWATKDRWENIPYILYVREDVIKL